MNKIAFEWNLSKIEGKPLLDREIARFCVILDVYLWAQNPKINYFRVRLSMQPSLCGCLFLYSMSECLWSSCVTLFLLSLVAMPSKNGGDDNVNCWCS